MNLNNNESSFLVLTKPTRKVGYSIMEVRNNKRINKNVPPKEVVNLVRDKAASLIVFHNPDMWHEYRGRNIHVFFCDEFSSMYAITLGTYIKWVNENTTDFDKIRWLFHCYNSPDSFEDQTNIFLDNSSKWFDLYDGKNNIRYILNGDNLEVSDRIILD